MLSDSGLKSIVIAHGEKFARSRCRKQLQEHGVKCVQVATVDELIDSNAALFIVDHVLVAGLPDSWRQQLSVSTLVGAEENLDIDADFYLPQDFTYRTSLKNIRMAMINAVQKRYIDEQSSKRPDDIAHESESNSRLAMLAELGIALSAEKKLSTLLGRILSEGRAMACCDAVSLFLVDQSEPDNPQLKFMLAQNASIDFPFQEKKFSLNDGSIAGYVAAHGAELNIDDAYHIDPKAPYQFNRSFDEEMHYRSVSLLAIPMMNHREEVIGVLQFINRTRTAGVILNRLDEVHEHVVPFDEGTKVVLRALASQSAIAIENRMLIESIKRLFDGFVQASVAAIEQRDPTTSGHSFRVADLCLKLAEVMPMSKESRFRDYQFSSRDLTSLRYAALLHDFGKVGVRESVLVKPKKLTAHQYDVLRYRIRLTQEYMRRQALEKHLQIVKQGGGDADIRLVNAQAEDEIARLDEFWQRIQNANEPSVLPDGYFDHLREIRQLSALNAEGEFMPLITDKQHLALSVPKGSLTDEERDEIQSHVVHTENFLRLIPWTPELADIPDIAGAHHEKCDGSGYPQGITSEQIPLPSRIMTVCDIYDALTASDRPYKPAVPLNVAFNILQAEAQRGMLETELVRLFIDAKVHEVIEGKQYHKANCTGSGFHHHVCDFDLMD
ncbi:MAG: GAF domain-containing protein [Hahellaceae bacterium]|nr:GAF domain-containing protein [Hahellaceae bacterium]MCP5211113.1 GAF domain-containing protein [Hahellaceae bacterium]